MIADMIMGFDVPGDGAPTRPRDPPCLHPGPHAQALLIQQAWIPISMTGMLNAVPKTPPLVPVAAT